MSDEPEIFAIAVRAFADRGFAGTTFAQMEEELGVSPGALAERYGSLDRLWELAVLEAFNQHHDLVFNRCAAVFASHAREIDRLEQLIAIFIESAGEHPELQRVIDHEGAHESPRVDTIFQHVVAPLIDAFRPMVDSLVMAREIRPISDREVFFLIANGAAAVHALAPLSARFDERAGAFDAAEYARSVARLIVAGLRLPDRRGARGSITSL